MSPGRDFEFGFAVDGRYFDAPPQDCFGEVDGDVAKEVGAFPFKDGVFLYIDAHKEIAAWAPIASRFPFAWNA